MVTKTKYPRSIGEIVRAEDESFVMGDNNIIETYQITDKLTLTIIEAYFEGMVGELICAHSYYITDFSNKRPEITPINTEEDLRIFYRKAKGKTLRLKLWYFIKNFRGWSEDPRPYVI